MADVIVEIGAKIDQLNSAVNEAKGKISELGDTAESMGGTFSALGPIIAEAFSIAAIGAFLEKMMELAAETDRMSLILGEPTQKIAGLRFAAEEGGTTIEAMATSFQRLMVNMQRAERDGFSPAAQVMAKLHITSKDFLGLDFEGKMLKLSAATAKFSNASGNLAEGLRQLGVRNQELIAMLLKGPEALQENIDKGTQLAGITKEQNDAILELRSQWNELKTLFAGFAAGPVMGAIISIFQSTRDEVNLIAGAIERLRSSVGLFTGIHLPGGGGPAAPGEGEGKPDFGAADAALKKRLEIQQEIIDQQLAKEKAGFEALKPLYEANVATYKMTQYEKVVATGAVNIEILQAEVDALTAKRNLWQQGTLEWEKAEKARQAATAKVTVEIAKSQADNTKAAAAEWQKLGGILDSSLNSQIRGLITGTETFGTAMTKVLQDIVIKTIEAVAQLLIMKTIVGGLTTAFPGVAPISGLTSLFGSLLGKSSLQEGSAYTSGGFAMLHPGEMVLPPSFSDQIRAGTASLGGGGGGQATINISALDAASVASLFRGPTGQAITAGVAQAMTRNPNLRPSY